MTDKRIAPEEELWRHDSYISAQVAAEDARQGDGFLTFRDQEYYANLQEQLDAMNDADLTERANAVMREFDERCAEVYNERRAGYWMDAPQLTRGEQMVIDEYLRRNE